MEAIGCALEKRPGGERQGTNSALNFATCKGAMTKEWAWKEKRLKC